MKLQSIGISNFKAFGQKMQRIPIKPITLVFGPNSAGKSSLLHSLLWLNHAMTRGETEIFHPVGSGNAIDLGGYNACLNRKSDSNCMSFEIEIANPNAESTKTRLSEIRSFRLQMQCERIRKAEPPRLVRSYLSADGELFLMTYLGRGQNQADHIVSVEWKHRAIPDFFGLANDQAQKLGTISSLCSYKLLHTPFFPSKLLPDEIMELVVGTESVELNEVRSFVLQELPAVVSSVFLELGKPIREMQYLPPLREIPDRSTDLRACELAGWRWLTKRLGLVHRINETLERLKFDHRVQLRELMPVDALESTFIAATCHAEAGDNWGALSHAVERARSEWEFFSYEEKRRWIKAHPAFFREIIAYSREMISDPFYWDGYYEDQPDANDQDMPPESWFRMESERMAWTFVDDWDFNSESSFYDEAVRLHISENLDVCEALAGSLAGRPLKNLIESKVERVELRLHDPKNGIWTALQDVGVGTSQSLPIILEAFAQENKLIAIEQPELHLHPALQAELGDVFIESALGENKNTFLLETHSEHLILRILRRIRETTEGETGDWPEALRNACPNGIRPEDVAVLYVQPGENGSEVIELPVDGNGEFTCEWPGGFFEERLREFF